MDIEKLDLLTKRVTEDITFLINENPVEDKLAFVKHGIALLKQIDASNGNTFGDIDEGRVLMRNLIINLELEYTALTGESVPDSYM